MEKELLDIKQVQAILRVSERTVFRLIEKGKLHGFKAGREWRFTQADLDKYIEDQRREAENIKTAA
jgi:excisionase family DNA binding protein